jgi:UDP-GlcNAc:undecaprenyl-phosphate GlcNAc-1-phosphate transferase
MAAGLKEMSPLMWALRGFAAGLLLGVLACPILPAFLKRLGLERTNYRGEPIGAGAGILFLVGILPWLAWPFGRDTRMAVLTAAGFGLLGLVDDRWGSAQFKGLRGHMSALLRGRISTGLLKAAGGIVLAGYGAWAIRPGWEALPGALLIALSANLFNLLDLRPLRALKLFWLLALPLLSFSGPVLWSTLGLTLPYSRLEARRRVMLGDTGANLLGGLLGFYAAAVLPPPAQAAIALLLVVFHAWAEKNSLTRWIALHGWARRIDEWGRAPDLPSPATDPQNRAIEPDETLRLP